MTTTGVDPKPGGPVVAWDTNCFIYFLQGAGVTGAGPAAELRWRYLVGEMRAFEAGTRRCVASTLAMAEMTAGASDPEAVPAIVERLQDIPGLRWIPVDEGIALEAGRVRRRYGLSLPDALHLASARAAGAAVFLTNDRAVQRASAYLPVAILDDLAAEGEG